MGAFLKQGAGIEDKRCHLSEQVKEHKLAGVIASFACIA